MIFIAAGAMLVWYNDIRHESSWFDKFYKKGNPLVVTLEETPVEKTRTLKANTAVNFIFQNEKAERVKGNIILYFAKDSLIPGPAAGARILFNGPIQEIRNAGNPGNFDYKRFCLFQGLTHQVYLRPGEFIVLNEKNEQWLSGLINDIRQKVLGIIRAYIPGEKEKGLAEALLIGYKNDLDKTLVQSYTNTGVVHIIAISGLHLGLIYWLLVQILNPLRRKKHIRWLRPVSIIAGLWLFSLLTGAQPSILRSAVMFTCIVLGETVGRKSSIYNSLAASAFILLCYNPFWLWDAGFQLSYAAVLSIVIFRKPVYNWFYIKNKLPDLIWKMNAVTISAQILTLPICIYHFHQFPNFLLLTNLVAVPLSSLIVFGEILLCITAFIRPLAFFTGKILYGLIWFMNTWIERIEALPFALWEGLQISVIQAILLMISIAAISIWLLEKEKKGFVTAIITLFCFVLLRSASFINAQDQHKIIVYNIPQKQAIDLIAGRNFSFIGDTSVSGDEFAESFYLKPSRMLNRVSENNNPYGGNRKSRYFTNAGKHILLMNKDPFVTAPEKKETIDLLIFSGKAEVYLPKLVENIDIRLVVFDGSVLPWKSKSLKRNCDSLHIPWHDVSEKGAFVMNLR